MPGANKLDFPIISILCFDVLYPLSSNAVGGVHVLVLPTLEVKGRIVQRVLGMLPNWVLGTDRKSLPFMQGSAELCSHTPAK